LDYLVGNNMFCEKCTGKMVYERFYDYLDEMGKYSFGGCRCLYCGNIVDPIILANRRNKIPLKSRMTRKRKFHPL